MTRIGRVARWLLRQFARRETHVGDYVRFALAERSLRLIAPRYVMSEYGRSWLHDPIVEECRRVPGGARSADRKFFVQSLLQLTEGIEGDFAECGCYEGATAKVLARHLGNDRELHLFDSFEGLSKPLDSDGTWWERGSLATTEDRLLANLSDFRGINVYKGWIPKRLSEVADKVFAFVHIDVDLFEPTADSLEFFYARVAAGGVIVCDDYGFDTCPGARRAMDEFFADKPEPVLHVPTGQGVVLKR